MQAPELNVRYVAKLARLALTDEEVTTLQAQLENVLGYVTRLDAVDVTGIEPTAHSNDVVNVLRPDVAAPSFTPDEALANAPAQSGGQFLVTRVVD